jgi:hypothetical protein
LRHALTTKVGVTALVVALALVGTPTLLGVARSDANDVRRQAAPAASGDTGRMAAPSRTPTRARVTHGIPFTSFDLFLLASGGGVVLLAGVNIGRRNRPRHAPEPHRAQA